MLCVRRAALRTQSMNNLKQLAIGMHNHHAASRVFPGPENDAPAQDGNPQTKHPYSWRVALLPYIGHADLHKQYKFDQPWDSQDNLKVMKRMPAVFRHPQDPPDSTETSYFLISGPKTIFEKGKKPEIHNIRDGTSNTIMIVEAKRRTPWTKPEDLVSSADKPLPKFGGYSPQGFNAAFGDGSVRFIAKAVDEKLLRGMITANGQEVIRP